MLWGEVWGRWERAAVLLEVAWDPAPEKCPGELKERTVLPALTIGSLL